MEDMVLPLLPLIGLIGGFVSGFLGLGGGVTFLPLLTFLANVPLKLAAGTTLVQIIVASTTVGRIQNLLLIHFRLRAGSE